MLPIKLGVIFAVLLLATALQTTASFAQATRTWVSGVGDDVNPCSRTAPCKTFAGAISKTATGGEINILDPGAYGTVTITKSISIIAEGFTAGVLAAGTNGIIVNAPAGSKVLVQGLDIEGANGTASPGLNGIRMIGLGRLTIRKCNIRNFNGFGVDVQGQSGAATVIEDSVIFGNVGGGVNIAGAGAGNPVFLYNSTLDFNSAFSVRVAGPSTLTMNGNILMGASVGIAYLSGGTVTSYGQNVNRNSGVPTTTLMLQ